MVKKGEGLEHFLELIHKLEPGETRPLEPYPDWRSRLSQEELNNPALAPYATKGRANMLKKYDSMRRKYAEQAETAVENYDALPFGPLTKRSFRAGMETAPETFRNKITTSHEKKWAAKWIRGASR